MRRDLLAQLKTMPELARTNFDLTHLLKSCFNRGFLVLRRITWDSPASILEKSPPMKPSMRTRPGVTYDGGCNPKTGDVLLSSTLGCQTIRCFLSKSH